MAIKERQREVVGTANLKYGDQVIEDVQIAYITEVKEFKGKETTKYYYTTQPLPDLDIKPTDIRLYTRKGMNEDFDTVIKPLFEGREVLAKGLINSKKETYNAYLTFEASQTPSWATKGKIAFRGDLNSETEGYRRKKEQSKESAKA